MDESRRHTEGSIGRIPAVGPAASVIPVLRCLLRRGSGRGWSLQSAKSHWLLALLLLLFARSATAQNRMGQQHYAKTKEVSVDTAEKQLSSSDPDARLEGVKALARSQDSKAIDALIKAVGDSDIRVQAKAIQELGDARARPATLVLTQQLLLHSTDANLQQLLVTALGKIGDPGSAPALMEFLRRHLDVATRATAVYALGDIGAFESLQTLEQIAEADEDQTVRRIAREAIGKIQGPHALRNQEGQGSPGDLPKPAPVPQMQRGIH
jgi:hypothetical protein